MTVNDMEVCAYSPGTREEDYWEFKATLIYLGS